MEKGRLPLAFLLPALLLFEGCGLRDITPGKSEIEAIKRERITAVTYAPPPFIAEYPGVEEMKYSSGLYWYWSGVWEWPFEWNAMRREGKRLVDSYGLVDPSKRVSGVLAGYLEKDLGFARIERENESPGSDSLTDLRKRFGNGVVLDFMTTSWRLTHFAFDWKHYRVSLKVRGRLIDLKDSSVIWRGWCSFTGKKTAESAAFDGLTANGGKRLKEMLAEAEDHCAGEFKARFRRFE